MKHLTSRSALTTLGIILIVLLIVLLFGGGYAGMGVLGYGPASVVVLILILLLILGRL